MFKLNNRKRVSCPFCEGDGCCFCDHEGKMWVGPKEFIKSEKLLDSIGVKYLKEENPEEIWPEMWEFFLKEENVPKSFKERIAKESSKPEIKQLPNK